MVSREICPHCRGNKWVSIKAPDGRAKPKPCPHCAGAGYKVRITHGSR